MDKKEFLEEAKKSGVIKLADSKLRIEVDANGIVRVWKNEVEIQDLQEVEFSAEIDGIPTLTIKQIVR